MKSEKAITHRRIALNTSSSCAKTMLQAALLLFGVLVCDVRSEDRGRAAVVAGIHEGEREVRETGTSTNKEVDVSSERRHGTQAAVQEGNVNSSRQVTELRGEPDFNKTQIQSSWNNLFTGGTLPLTFCKCY